MIASGILNIQFDNVDCFPNRLWGPFKLFGINEELREVQKDSVSV